MRARGFVTLALSAAASRGLGAQSPKPFVVRMTVRDSAGQAVPRASASLIRGLSEVIGSANTDSNGTARIVVSNAPVSLQIVVRHLGFAPDARFITSTGIDSSTLEIRLARAPVALDSVRVTAAEDATRKSYYIDADAISTSRIPVTDALDVLTRLRPDMLKSRAPQICADSAVRGAHIRNPPAGGLANIWVNGKRIRLVESSPWVTVPHIGEVFVRKEIVDILEEIRPEHIQEIRYTDCFDTSVPGLGTRSAAFVILKTGIGYERGKGSFVVKPDSSGDS